MKANKKKKKQSENARNTADCFVQGLRLAFGLKYAWWYDGAFTSSPKILFWPAPTLQLLMYFLLVHFFHLLLAQLDWTHMHFSGSVFRTLLLDETLQC